MLSSLGVTSVTSKGLPTFLTVSGNFHNSVIQAYLDKSLSKTNIHIN